MNKFKIHRPLWIEIDLKNLKKNFNLVKRIVGKSVKVLGVIKQNAYGHGLIPIAKKLVDLGIDFLGVGSIEEAISLRKEKITTPLLILSAVFPQSIDEIINYRIRPAVMDLRFAEALDRKARKNKVIVPIHIKVDTGMGRLGVRLKEAPRFILSIKKLKNIFLEGIFTHFPSADIDPLFTRKQIQLFDELILKMRRQNVNFKYIHCANSIGLIKYLSSHFNLVRPGIILYGINPCSQLKLNLHPVLSLKSRVIFIKTIEKGEGVSYHRTYIAPHSVKIAVISCGYADGYPWNLSNKAKVIIRDRYFRLRGRVCMDHIMVEVKRDVKVGDEVILIGKSKEGRSITCEELAKWSETIPYEITTRLSLKIPRIYKG